MKVKVTLGCMCKTSSQRKVPALCDRCLLISLPATPALGSAEEGAPLAGGLWWGWGPSSLASPISGVFSGCRTRELQAVVSRALQQERTNLSSCPGIDTDQLCVLRQLALPLCALVSLLVTRENGIGVFQTFCDCNSLK